MRPGSLAAALLSLTAQGALSPPAVGGGAPTTQSGVALAQSTLRGIGFDETLREAAFESRAAGGVPKGIPLWARIRVGRADLESGEELERRTALHRENGVSLLLTLAELPRSPEEAEAFRQSLQVWATRLKGRVAAFQIGETASPTWNTHEYAYYLKLAAVQIRAADADALIVEATLPMGMAEWQKQIYEEDVAAYVDGTALGVLDPEIITLVKQEDPTASLLVTGVPLEDDSDKAASTLLISHVQHVADDVRLTTYRAASPPLRGAAALKDLLAEEVVSLDEKAAALDIKAPGAVSHRLLYNVASFSTYLALWGAPGSVDVTIAVATAHPPRALSGEARIENFRREEAGISRFTVRLESAPMLLDFNVGEETFVSRADVRAASLPTVDEILFRHQRAQAAQDVLIENVRARARIALHFRVAAGEPGWDVVTDNNFYSDREGSEWEELSFSVNGAQWGPDRPAFPLLQPEKALALPLDLRLDRSYRYRLEGVDDVEGRRCYVLKFEPATDTATLYRGKVWIDGETFMRVRVQAVQMALQPPVVSNEETQLHAPVAELDGRPLQLLNRLSNKQLFLIAGRNILVEREVTLTDFEVNSKSFLEARTGARQSDRIMYRDTDQGLRHFVKSGGERVVSDKLTRSAKALAMGVTVDPSFDFPLPIFGINYLDFDFLDKNLQFALLFGGVLALGNVQQPKALGTPLDVSIDFFGIAVPVSDQVFDDRGEIREERFRSIPFSTGVNVGYQFTSFQKLTGSYQFRYDVYFGDDKTAPDFTAPVDTLTNGFGLSYEYRRGGYSFLASGSYNRRGAWERWGDAETPYDPDERNYHKWSVGLSKDFFFRTFHKIHLDGNYFGGDDLDRFSMYQFGLFSEVKMHGVPSAGVRFRELALFRASYSFNLFEQYRLDLFLDQSVGTTGGSAPWQPITGVGIGVNLRGPFKTLLRFDVGKSFLPEMYRGAGSTVIQVMVLKPL